MNDNGQPTDNPSGDAQTRTNKVLFKRELEPNQFWDVVIMVMEEDGGTSQHSQQIASTVLASINDPISQGASGILGALTQAGFFINDGDDFIGSICVQIDSYPRAHWRAGERGALNEAGVPHNLPDPAESGNPNKREFRLVGDGADYGFWFYIK